MNKTLKGNKFLKFFWIAFIILTLPAVLVFIDYNYNSNPTQITSTIYEKIKEQNLATPKTQSVTCITTAIAFASNNPQLSLIIVPFMILGFTFIVWIMGACVKGFGAVLVTRTIKGQDVLDKGWGSESVKYGVGIELIGNLLNKDK